jgi:hypothetical protein
VLEGQTQRPVRVAHSLQFGVERCACAASHSVRPHRGKSAASESLHSRLRIKARTGLPVNQRLCDDGSLTGVSSDAPRSPEERPGPPLNNSRHAFLNTSSTVSTFPRGVRDEVPSSPARLDIGFRLLRSPLRSYCCCTLRNKNRTFEQ